MTLKDIFSPFGRTDRGGFWVRVAVLLGVCILIPVCFGILAIQEVTTGVTPFPGRPILSLFSSLLLILSVVVYWVGSIRRLHDLGQSGWISLLNVVPVANLGLLLWLGFAPGKLLISTVRSPDIAV